MITKVEKVLVNEPLTDEELFVLKAFLGKEIEIVIKRNELEDKYEAQREYCKSKNYPMFAMKKCSCGHDVFKDYSLNESSSTLITSCKKCHRSFC